MSPPTRRDRRRLLRSLERRLYADVLHPHAEDLRAPPRPWTLESLRGHRYLLLVTYRRNGTPMPTPVWFAISGDRVVLRSAASDGKVKRIRNDPAVRIAACTIRGRALSPPMLGTARILGGEDTPPAEEALAAALGVQRRLYRLVRDPMLEAAYIEVRERDG